MGNKTKDELVKQEIERLNNLLRNVDENKRKSVDSLISNAAFMTVTLQDLQKEINKNGVTEEYKNGANQYGIKRSAAVDVYNTMIKNHVSVMKQLGELVPKTETSEDEFAAFMLER